MPFAQCNLSTQDEEAESYIQKPVGFVTSIGSGVNWWAGICKSLLHTGLLHPL